MQYDRLKAMLDVFATSHKRLVDG